MTRNELNAIVAHMTATHRDHPELDALTLIEWAADFWTGDIEDNDWNWTRPGSPVLAAAKALTEGR